MKRGEKLYKYLDISKGLEQRLWNIKMAVMPVIIGALVTIEKNMENWQGELETVQTTALLKSTRIFRRILVTSKDLLLLRLQWKIISWSWCEETIFCLMVGWVLWHIHLFRLFNDKSIFYSNDQFYFKQFSLAWVHSLIVKNISISSYSV